jgi:hypothetical protein
LIALYESHSASQFILSGNVGDQFLLPLGGPAALGSIDDFLLKVLMPRFDVVLSYDLGNGLRVEKGGELFSQWRYAQESLDRRTPRGAVETLTHYFRYAANLAQLGQKTIQVGCFVRAAQLVAPAVPGALNYDLNALASLLREWSTDKLLRRSPLVTFLMVENLHDLHPLLVNNTQAATVKVPLPSATEMERALSIFATHYPAALGALGCDLPAVAAQLTGATLGAAENLLRLAEHRREPLRRENLVKLKKELVEKECNGLIEFIESRRTLDDLHGQEKLKAWLRQDLALWRQNDLRALPMGYLICGPVGTGKTYMVECLAGEAGVPVVKIKNFRDKWVGSTEGNLETIFRLLQALGRCVVFIDEADQALGRRDAGSNDAGLSGRVYAMFAKEMSNSANRGRIVWVLASSRPDLIEVDLKRPGRVDVKIPIFPTTTPEEGFALLRALTARLNLTLAEAEFAKVRELVPRLLTPGAAETLAIKLYREVKTTGGELGEILHRTLLSYQSPVAREIMDFQIGLAVQEASDMDFVPEAFRAKSEPV